MTEETIRHSVEALGEALSVMAMQLIPQLEQINRSMRYSRLPGEHPAKYVMRIGPESGHTIHPGEEWRYVGRPYDDWWGYTDKDRDADWMFHEQAPSI